MSLQNNLTYLLSGIAMLSAAVSVTSCLNEDYDLTKDIDTNISIDGDISAPLGNSELILVDDFLNLGNDAADVLKTDASGNYYISVTGRGTSSDVELPFLSFSDELVTDGGYIAKIKKSELPLPSSGAVPAEQYTKHFNVSSTPMTVNEDVPHEIRAVKDAEVSGVVKISLMVTTGKATLSDLIIDFPEYLEFADVKDAGLNFNPDGNLLTIKSPQISTMAKNYYLNVVGIDFDKIPSGQGFLPSQHKIVLNDEIKLSAFDVNAVLSDFVSIDEVKKRLHVPIMLLHECSITKGARDLSPEYLEKIKRYHLNRAERFFMSHNNKQKKEGVYGFENIMFHLILFPVPNKENIVNWFVERANQIKQDA